MANSLARKEKNNFDQFYTNPLTAKKLTSVFLEEIKKLNYQKITFIEPAAGTGNFCEAMKETAKNNPLVSKKILAFDIEPKSNKENIIPANFLTIDWKRYCSNLNQNNYVVLGNPPFGKKGKLALEFINKSVEMIDTVGFILPLTFRRWSIQSKLNKDLKLVYDN